MAEKAGVAYPYLIICELCELCEQMCRLSIFSGKCLYFQDKTSGGTIPHKRVQL